MPHTDYVVNLALAKCSMGTIPLPLPVTSQLLHTVNGLAVATELDLAPLLNIPCFGLCKMKTAVPPPGNLCLPVPTGWNGANPARKIMGLKPLLEKATCQCGMGGTVSFQSSGQLGPAKFQTGPNFIMLTAGNATDGWNKQLNKVPLEPDHEYLVDNYLYSTDSQGRVVKVRGDLENQERDRYPSQQSRSVPRKDGQGNPQRQPKPATPQPDARTLMERRRFTDDGGHLLASMFNGPGEQINYVPMAMRLNQAGGEWYKMEQELKTALRGTTPPPPHPKPVDVEITMIYGVDKRPRGFQVKCWITEPDGSVTAKDEQFRNQ